MHLCKPVSLMQPDGHFTFPKLPDSKPVQIISLFTRTGVSSIIFRLPILTTLNPYLAA